MTNLMSESMVESIISDIKSYHHDLECPVKYNPFISNIIDVATIYVKFSDSIEIFNQIHLEAVKGIIRNHKCKSVIISYTDFDGKLQGIEISVITKVHQNIEELECIKALKNFAIRDTSGKKVCNIYFTSTD